MHEQRIDRILQSSPDIIVVVQVDRTPEISPDYYVQCDDSFTGERAGGAEEGLFRAKVMSLANRQPKTLGGGGTYR